MCITNGIVDSSQNCRQVYSNFIVVFDQNCFTFVGDGIRILEITDDMTEFIASGMTSTKAGSYHIATVVAKENNTVVTVYKPDSLFVDSKVVTAIINSLQTFTYSEQQDLTGLYITTSKGAAVFFGVQCGFVPAGALECDSLYDQLPPFTMLGTNYVLPPIGGLPADKEYYFKVGGLISFLKGIQNIKTGKINLIEQNYLSNKT